jgi:serine/threonine-protein kinase
MPAVNDDPGDGTTATVAMPVRPRARPAIATPDDVLHADESERTRLFAWFICGLVVAVIATLPLLDGDRLAQWIHIAGLSVAGATALWLLLAARGPDSYRPWHNVVFGHGCVVAIATAFYFWGPLSAALLVVPFGAFIFSMGRSFAGAASITIHLMVLHALIAIAVTSGVIADRSVIAASHLSVVAQLVILALVHAIFAMTFLIARQLRGASRQTIEQLESALRALGQREAQLIEAQLGLREAVMAGAQGRFSNHVIGGLRLGALVGRGGMGEIYEATRPGSEEARFAVKLLHPHLVQQPGAYQRFAREARAAASLDVPNVVKILGVSEEGALVPYLVMEKLDGSDLAAMLQARAQLDPADAVELIRQLADALAAAHGLGIVHRDLKPQNIFATQVDGRRVWKLLDFGVSKLADGGGTLTHGHVVGTPAYMSPEQARGQPVDHRSDLYSLAVVAYRVLTGRPVIAVSDTPAMLYEVCYGMPPRPSSLVALPDAVDAVLAIGLAKEPDGRFATAGELADALARAVRGELAADLRERALALEARHPWQRGLRPAIAPRR